MSIYRDFGRRTARAVRPLVAALGMLVLAAQAAHAAPITYQGVLNNAGSPASGEVTLRAQLFDAPTGGTQVGSTVTTSVTPDDRGVFAARLDFGAAAFTGAQPRWVQFEVGAPAPDGTITFTPLTPRQPIDAAPQAQGLVGVPLTLGGPTVVDQSQTAELGIGYGVSDTWQSFTAGISGTLTGVNVQVREASTGNPGSISVQVRAGLGSGGAVLGSGSLTYPAVDESEFKRQVTIPVGSIPIVAGQKYTLVFTGSSFLRTSAGPIPGSQGFQSGSTINFWFQTLVTPLSRMEVVASTADYAVSAQSAVTAQNAIVANSAATAQTAVLAQSATTAVWAQNLLWSGLTGQAEVRTDAIASGWQMFFTNNAQANFRGAMRLSDSGFFEVTNSANVALPNVARLSSSGLWSSVSDARLKHDVASLSTADELERVLKLRPVAFTWNDSGRRDVGLIAQDVRGVMPELVVGDEAKEMLTVNYSQLSVAAVAAIQELNQRLEQERADRAAERAQHELDRAELVARLETLAARLEALEAQRSTTTPSLSTQSDLKRR